MMTVCAGRLTPQASVAVVQSTCKPRSASHHRVLKTYMHSSMDRKLCWADVSRLWATHGARMPCGGCHLDVALLKGALHEGAVLAQHARVVNAQP